MAEVAIVTDASVDLPPELAREAGLVVAPLSYDAGGRHFVTGEQTMAEFYAGLAAGGSALVEGVSADDFESALREAASRADEVICACQSVGSTFTRVSAEVAIRRLQDEGKLVRLISPGRSTAGLGALCLVAARSALAGASADAVFRLLEDGSALSDTYAVPGDLSFLERTGELASLSSQSSAGPIDSGTPVFRVRGRVSAAAATRDHNEAQATIVERVVHVAASAPAVIVIAHAGAEDRARELARAVEARLPGCEVHVSDLGPSIGAVLGPGSYALGFCAAQGC